MMKELRYDMGIGFLMNISYKHIIQKNTQVPTVVKNIHTNKNSLIFEIYFNCSHVIEVFTMKLKVTVAFLN